MESFISVDTDRHLQIKSEFAIKMVALDQINSAPELNRFKSTTSLTDIELMLLPIRLLVVAFRHMFQLHND